MNLSWWHLILVLVATKVPMGLWQENAQRRLIVNIIHDKSELERYLLRNPVKRVFGLCDFDEKHWENSIDDQKLDRMGTGHSGDRYVGRGASKYTICG